MFILMMLFSTAFKCRNAHAQSYRATMMNVTYSDDGIYGHPGYWAYEGDSVHMTCRKPEILKHGGRGINLNDSRIHFLEDSTVHSNCTNFIIKDVTYTDQGLYSCGEHERALLRVEKTKLADDAEIVDRNKTYCILYPQRLNCHFYITKSPSLPQIYRVSYSIYSRANGNLIHSDESDCRNSIQLSPTAGTSNHSLLVCEESSNIIKNYFYIFEITALSPLHNITSTYNITLSFDIYGDLPCALLNLTQRTESLMVTYGFEQFVDRPANFDSHSQFSLNSATTHGVEYKIVVSFQNYTVIVERSYVDVSKSVEPNNLILDLPVLPYTKYSVSMQCRPATSKVEQIWTDSVIFNHTTRQSRPQAAPRIPGCGFTVLSRDNDFIMVRLYWESVSELAGHGNGPIIGYSVTIHPPHIYHENLMVVKDNQADVKLDSKKDNFVWITALNSVGAANTSAEIFIPMQTQGRKLSGCEISVEEIDRSSIRIRWVSQLNSTIYMCRKSESSCSPKEPVDALIVPSGALSYQLNLSEPFTSRPVRFGLSHEDGDRSSGIIWVPCIHSITSSYPELPEITVKFTFNTAHISFQPTCETRTAKADFFLLNWCELTGDVCQQDYLLELDHCQLEEQLEIDLQYSREYEFWLTSHQDGLSTRYGEPIDVTSPHRELQVGQWVLIILGALASVALLTMISISSYRQRMKLKAVRSPVALQPIPLEDMAFHSREGDDNSPTCTADSGFLNIKMLSEYYKFHEADSSVTKCSEILSQDEIESGYHYGTPDNSFLYITPPTLEHIPFIQTGYRTDDSTDSY